MNIKISFSLILNQSDTRRRVPGILLGIARGESGSRFI